MQTNEVVERGFRPSDFAPAIKAKKETPQQREARIQLYAYRAANDLDLFTGQPRHPQAERMIEDDEVEPAMAW